MGSTGDQPPLEVGHQLPAKVSGGRKQAPGGTDRWVSKGLWVGKTTKANFFLIVFTSPLAFLGDIWPSLAPVTPFLSSATAHQEHLRATDELCLHKERHPHVRRAPLETSRTNLQLRAPNDADSVRISLPKDELSPCQPLSTNRGELDPSPP